MQPVNKRMKFEKFKMESLNSVRFLVRKGDFMVKLDLKDAYFVRPGKKITFQVSPFFLEETNLPIFQHGVWFGTRPCVFTKLMKVVVAIFLKKGV